jgi:pimeloyl-ACP methyl ester carboxylesterase
MHHPERVGRIATFGSLFGPPHEAIRPEMMGEPHELSPDGPDHRFQRESYERVAPDPDHWPVIWRKVIDLAPAGFTRDEIASVRHRVLVALGDNDFISLEHALYAYRTIPNAELAVIPDASHFLPYEEPERLEPVVARFFSAPDERLPFGTIETGYQPGRRR